jgi:hypothetical protein
MGRKCTSASVDSCRTNEEARRISEQVRIGETLRQDINGLLDNAFGLRRQWPVILQYLHSMSVKLQIAVDEISRVLARTNCLRPPSARGIVEKPKCTCTVALQAIQDNLRRY